MTNVFTIHAVDGALEIYRNDGNGSGVIAGNIQTAKSLAYAIGTYKMMDKTVYFSSSMDFADEYGFDHYDGAKDLWEEGVKRFFMTNEVN